MNTTSKQATETSIAPEFLAASYLRVSTREQAERGGTAEGFSIPAQREANRRKAQELGARIVHEFVDAGESARSADRNGLQEMLTFISATNIQFCIVHKLDRLARNRVDDVTIHQALLAAGVTLVSATESIDQTPSGMLLHGIMSSIAEFYSKNLAAEVSKGLNQKFLTGGTPMRAPIGYLNVRKRDERGREFRTVKLDSERAPLIRWVFEQYATRDRAVVDLLAEATARGLTTVPTPQRPSGPVARSGFFKLLRNPYYIGIVRYKGAEHPGAHEPLVDIDTWHEMQTLLDSRKIASERRRKHDHYLKAASSAAHADHACNSISPPTSRATDTPTTSAPGAPRNAPPAPAAQYPSGCGATRRRLLPEHHHHRSTIRRARGTSRSRLRRTPRRSKHRTR